MNLNEIKNGYKSLFYKNPNQTFYFLMACNLERLIKNIELSVEKTEENSLIR